MENIKKIVQLLVIETDKSKYKHNFENHQNIIFINNDIICIFIITKTNQFCFLIVLFDFSV